jgi:drug/metabolite transporter (DMT)-like permease
VLKARTLWSVGLLNALCIALQNVGMTMTTATNAVLLFNMCVGFVAIFAAVILKERLARQVILGIGVGMAGVLLISTNGDLSSIYSGTFQGNLLIFLSGVLWALCTVYLKRVVDGQRDALMVTAGMFIISSVFLAPLALAFTTNYAMGGLAWASVIWVGVVCTGAAFLAYNIGLRHVSVTAATVILLSEVVFTMLFALMLLGEVPTGSIALGGLLVVISVLMIAFSTSPAVENESADGAANKGTGPPSN